jgi:hypothetical protein
MKLINTKLLTFWQCMDIIDKSDLSGVDKCHAADITNHIYRSFKKKCSSLQVFTAQHPPCWNSCEWELDNDTILDILFSRAFLTIRNKSHLAFEHYHPDTIRDAIHRWIIRYEASNNR